MKVKTAAFLLNLELIKLMRTTQTLSFLITGAPLFDQCCLKTTLVCMQCPYQLE